MIAISYVRYATVAIFILLSGCSHRVPVATIEVIDTSLSITPRAEKAVINAVRDQIAYMQRGDLLVLIPITGDAANDAGGRILRLAAPTTRETYDTDLRRFQQQALKQFVAWTGSLDRHQSRTDILGALDAARQELVLLPPGANHRLVVASDFLEDDGTYRFVSARELVNPARAGHLARSLREQHSFTVQGVSLCLGRLESSDFAPLSAQRKRAVESFWTSYFASGETPVEIQFDGEGILDSADGGCFAGKP